MKTLYTSLGLLVAGLCALTLGATPTSSNTTLEDHPKVIVGTFDSRAVAVAYVRSEAFEASLRQKKAEVDQATEAAKAAGDKKRLAELEALGPAMQKRIHAQGFGAAPIDDIMEKIADKLPTIAKETGVDVIVSKWELDYHAPRAQFVDLTDRLAAEFHPDDSTLRVIKELIKTDPVPLDQLRDGA